MHKLLAIVLTVFALTTAAMTFATLSYTAAAADCNGGCSEMTGPTIR
jgi:hypothetical protein